MIIIDTNVVSSMMQERPDRTVSAWLDRQPPQSVWLTAVSVYEIRLGIEALASGRRQRDLEEKFKLALTDDFEARVLPFDEAAARIAARLGGERRRTGRNVETRDTMIAGIALSHHADLATRNIRHFADLDVAVINPWTE